MKKKGGANLKKTGRLTVIYIVVIGILFIILVPVYFLVSLSFLSTREAYQFPLPLVPDFTTEFAITHNEDGDGYVLYVYDDQEGEYKSVLDTSDRAKMSTYARTFLNTIVEEGQFEEQIVELEQQVEEDGIVYFTHRRDIFLNYKVFFIVTSDALPALVRSLQIAAITIIISLSIGGAAGYAFARYRFRGRNGLKFSVLFVRMFPAVAIAIPMILILADMGLYDQPLGLSLVYAVGSIGLTVWITASIFMGIPVSLEEAAQVFGATKLQAFARMTLPLAFPGLAASAMYTFLGAWTETVSAIILTQFNPTFPVVVYQFLLGSTGQVNLAAAGGMLMAIPALIFTFFIRRYINQMWGGVTV